MKTKKTTFVAVLRQTLTTTSTQRTTYRAGAAGNAGDDERRGGETRTLATIPGSVPSFTPQWCVECATPIAMMAPEMAAAVCFQSTREIYRLVEAGRVHFSDGPGGVMVCPASLMQDWARDRGMQLLTAGPIKLSACELEQS